MSTFFYLIFIKLYGFAIRIASLWNTKARLWVQGRKHFPVMHPAQPTIWMHCASLGEFEQGRPVLEALKTAVPSCKIIVSFFSPSGYEIRKKYPLADQVIYLPEDTRKNAQRLIKQMNPNLVIWIKYEYWHHHLQAIKDNDIPLLLVSGIFRPGQPFFKWYGKMWRTTLDAFTHFFVQDEKSFSLLNNLVRKEMISLTGDTRFDRVLEIAAQKKSIPEIEAFVQGRKCLVAGSTWGEDEKILANFIKQHPSYCYIIAPHEIGQQHLHQLLQTLEGAVLFSSLSKDKVTDAHVLIIDNIGMLSSLYAYGQVAYIGGGFGAGIHNILEACVYGIPVVFGPKHEKFREAVELARLGGAFPIQEETAATEKIAALMEDGSANKIAGTIAGNYVIEKAGATKKIVDYIILNRLLTK